MNMLTAPSASPYYAADFTNFKALLNHVLKDEFERVLNPDAFPTETIFLHFPSSQFAGAFARALPQLLTHIELLLNHPGLSLIKDPKTGEEKPLLLPDALEEIRLNVLQGNRLKEMPLITTTRALPIYSNEEKSSVFEAWVRSHQTTPCVQLHGPQATSWLRAAAIFLEAADQHVLLDTLSPAVSKELMDSFRPRELAR